MPITSREFSQCSSDCKYACRCVPNDTPIAEPRRALTSGSSTLTDHLRDPSIVKTGWLHVASNLKRTFKQRFCILQGVRFSYFLNNDPEARPLATHVVVDVKRLHCINRAFVIIDAERRQLWAHVDHDTAILENWLAIFQSELEYHARIMDGTYFLRPIINAQLSTATNDIHSAFTGWLILRKHLFRLKWLFSVPQKWYFVLSGRHLAAFEVNMEGRWADFYGRIATAKLIQDGKWIQIILENKGMIELASRKEGGTMKWFQRIQQVLAHKE